MRAALLATLAASAILYATRVDAFPPAATPDAPAAPSAVIQKIHSICTSNGCSMIQTKKVQHHKAPGNVAPKHI
jgi:hypothetical protein